VDGKTSVNAKNRHAVWRRKPAPGTVAMDVSLEVFIVSRIGFRAKNGFISVLLLLVLLLALRHR
jgi:hypothetical protein